MSKLFVGLIVSTESMLLNPGRPLKENSGFHPVSKGPLSQRKRLDFACGLEQQLDPGNNLQKTLTAKYFDSALISEVDFPLEPLEQQGNAVSLVFKSSFPGLSPETNGLNSMVEIISL